MIQLNGGADRATLSLEGESRSKQEEKKKRREYRAVVTRTSPHFSSSRVQESIWDGIAILGSCTCFMEPHLRFAESSARFWGRSQTVIIQKKSKIKSVLAVMGKAQVPVRAFRRSALHSAP